GRVGRKQGAENGSGRHGGHHGTGEPRCSGGWAGALPPHALADLLAQVGERGGHGVAERAGCLLQTLLGLLIAERVAYSGERMVELIDGLLDRVVHRPSLFFSGASGSGAQLAVVLADAAPHFPEALADLVPRLPGLVVLHEAFFRVRRLADRRVVRLPVARRPFPPTPAEVGRLPFLVASMLCRRASMR